MRKWDSLNDRQLAVLKRVASGDTLHDADSTSHRSATALRDRGLVMVSKRDGWHVTLTEAGQFYIDHGCHPDHPVAPTTSTRVSSVAKPKSSRTRPSRARAEAGTTSVTTTRRPPPHATARIANVRRVAAEELLAELLVTPRIRLTEQTPERIAEQRRVVDFAKRNGLVPPGKYLEMKRKRFNQVEIILRDGQHPNSKQANAGLPVVPMPTDLRSLHPVVAALDKDRGRLAMPGLVRRRSLLFLHGLTREAVRRGCDVREQPVPERYRYQYWDREHPGHRTYSRRDGELNIVVDGFAYTVTITQESPESDVDDRWERLVVSLTAYQSQGRQYSWHDRKRVTIDDCIGRVLHEIETRAAEDKQRQAEAERQQAERKTQWEAAMERARERATQVYYASHLEDQVGAWQRMHDIRKYCDALEERIRTSGDDDQAAEATQWLTWARDYASIIDPLRTLPTMSEAPDIQKPDLEPFLDGWSPYGPEEPTAGRRR